MRGIAPNRCGCQCLLAPIVGARSPRPPTLRAENPKLDKNSIARPIYQKLL